MAALLSLLINKHGHKEDRHLNKYRVYPSGSKRRKKARGKMREDEVAAKSRIIVLHNGSEVQWRHFCGTYKRTENQRTYCDGLRST